jgi:hypothetical protein
VTGRQVVTQLILGLLAAGALKFVTDIIGIRRARRLEGDERGSIVAGGAEKAVIAMKTALDAAEARAAAAEARAAAAEARLLRVEGELRELQDEVHGYTHRPGSTRLRADDGPGA